MPGMIVFLCHNELKQDRLADFQLYYQECVALIEAAKPGTVVFHAYHDKKRNEVSIIHLFSDAEAMDCHMDGAKDRLLGAREFLYPKRLEVYGEPGEAVLEMLEEIAGTGVELHVDSGNIGGFIRTRPD